MFIEVTRPLADMEKLYLRVKRTTEWNNRLIEQLNGMKEKNEFNKENLKKISRLRKHILMNNFINRRAILSLSLNPNGLVKLGAKLNVEFIGNEVNEYLNTAGLTDEYIKVIDSEIKELKETA